MANIVNIQEYGNQLAVIFDDGSKKLAYPTATGVYVVTNPEEAPVPPKPPGPTGDSFIWPFSLSEVTSEFGPRWGRLHAGMDFSGRYSGTTGTPIPASGAGRVIISKSGHGGYGEAVVIDHGGGRCTLYGHMHPGSRVVSVGQNVTKGQKLGGIGQSGASRGVHLHFETHEGGYRWNTSARNPRLMLPKWNG